MITMWRDTGPFAWPLLLIAVLAAVAAVRAAVQVLSDARGASPELQHRIHSVLFWGAAAAAVGFLGQHAGIYNSITGALAADMVRPGPIAKGVAESMGASILGLLIFSVAGIVWFLLQARYRRALS